ncbi:MAG TPA: hypothetical protein VH253_18555 [Phycisphaerae bacterium]|nr:hypothetical protein [Phycisphaerae bacterium]
MIPLADTLLEQFPWLPDLGWALGALALVCLAVYVLRPGIGGDFAIHVDGADVLFSGKIPAAARSAIEDFLTQDVAIPAAYTIRGKWDGRVLAITVSPPAKPVEQRIRNFLKLTLKPPLAAPDE